MKDTVVFIAAILGIVILGVIIAAVEISPERLSILRGIIDILAVVLGVSGRAAVPAIMRRIRHGGRP